MATKRIETGPMHFKDDWTGLFLRGDDALRIAASVRVCEEWLQSIPCDVLVGVSFAFAQLTELAALIEGEVVEKARADGK